jgi:hypothetical protein
VPIVKDVVDVALVPGALAAVDALVAAADALDAAAEAEFAADVTLDAVSVMVSEMRGKNQSRCPPSSISLAALPSSE